MYTILIILLIVLIVLISFLIKQDKNICEKFLVTIVDNYRLDKYKLNNNIEKKMNISNVFGDGMKLFELTLVDFENTLLNKLDNIKNGNTIGSEYNKEILRTKKNLTSRLIGTIKRMKNTIFNKARRVDTCNSLSCTPAKIKNIKNTVERYISQFNKKIDPIIKSMLISIEHEFTLLM